MICLSEQSRTVRPVRLLLERSYLSDRALRFRELKSTARKGVRRLHLFAIERNAVERGEAFCFVGIAFRLYRDVPRRVDYKTTVGGIAHVHGHVDHVRRPELGRQHEWNEATAVEYLKVLAISRIYLSNFLNVQSSWVTQGLKVCQMGLRFGGNDVGSVMIEENVVRAAGVTNCTTEEELRRIIRDAGFRPAQRDTLYRQYFLN